MNTLSSRSHWTSNTTADTMASISPTTRKRQLQQQPPGAVSVGRSNNYSINVNSFAHTSILSPDHKLLSGGPPTPGQSFGTQGPLLPIRGPRSKLLFQRTSSMPLFAASPSLENLNAVQGDVQNYCHQLIEQCIEEQNEYIDLSCLSLLHIPDVIENLKFIPISKCKLHLLDRLLDSRCGGDLLTSTDGSVAHTGVLSSTSTQTGSLAPRLQVYLQGNNLTEINTKLFSVTNIQILSIRNNRIRKIHQGISKLKHLEELSIGGNQLKFLPAELKEVSSLKILIGDPNPCLTPTQMKNLNEENMKLFCRQSDDAEMREGMNRSFFPCPSLKELASRDWLTEQRSHSFISPSLLLLPNHLALDLHAQSTSCSQCKKIIHTHFLCHYKMETLTCFNNGQSVPFEYIICSLECLFTMK